MRSINLTKLCMEEDDPALKKEVRCNHGFVGPRSCDFWCWRDKENTDPRSKFVIPKLIEKMGELENLLECSQYLGKHTTTNDDEKLVEIEEASEEVDNPTESKQDDNWVKMKFEKLKGEIEKMKKREKKCRSNMVKQRTRENALFFVVFCCIIAVVLSYWFGVIYMKKDSMKLP